MLTNGNLQRARQGFSDQFEPYDGGRFLYRRSQKGPPIPVTAEERQRFIDQYIRRLRYGTWGMVAAMLAAAGAILWWNTVTDGDPGLAIWIGIVGLLVPFLIWSIWIYGAPAREIEGRSPVGAERSPEEMRARLFAKLTYRHLALVALTGVFLVVRMAMREDVLVGWHRVWLLLGAAVVLIAVVQAFRKWRFGSKKF